MTTRTVASAYKDIFVVCPDVYSLGGSAAFDALGAKRPDTRNLVVVPQEFIDNLDEIKSKGMRGAAGADDALEVLDGLVLVPDRQHRSRTQYGKPTPISDSLDVKVLDYQEGEDFSVRGLAERVAQRYGKSPRIISNAASLRIKLRNRNLIAEKPEFLMIDADIASAGIITGTDELHAALQGAPRGISIAEALGFLAQDASGADDTDDVSRLYPNQFIAFRQGDRTYYAKVGGAPTRSHDRVLELEPTVRLLGQDNVDRRLIINGRPSHDVLGVKPRDDEQWLAFQHILLNPDITVGFITGSQGSGKTLLTYAAAIRSILSYGHAEGKRKRGQGEIERRRYERIILLKSNDLVGGKGRDVGFLPGSLYEKIRPFLASYVDCHKETVLRSVAFEEMLMHPQYANDFGKRQVDAQVKGLTDGGNLPFHEVLELEYSAFIRGRTFQDTLVIIDEAQNFTPYEVKTIIERTGEGSAVMVLGDPQQTDNSICSRDINGLTSAMAFFLPEPFSASVCLSRNYRSQASDHVRGWKVF